MAARRTKTTYFLAAGFVLSCLGFIFFLSFFCALLPLPMMLLLWVGDENWLRTSHVSQFYRHSLIQDSMR